MKIIWQLATIFAITFFIYFAVGTEFSFKPKWGLDYFNPMAEALLQLRLDIPNPTSTYDLAEYKGKWYAPWGIAPALFLIPIHFIVGRYVPIFYLSLFFASFNAVIMYLLLKRLKEQFLPQFSLWSILIVLVLFTFGTTHFYVGTLPGIWHVSQMFAFSLGMLATLFIFKKKRESIDYLIASLLLSFGLFSRPTIAFLLALPIFLYVYEFWFREKNFAKRVAGLKKGFLIFGLPLGFFLSAFFLYNYVRFENIFEYGYNYIHEQSYVRQIREAHGVSSIANIPQNLWYLLFEIPSLSLEKGINLGFNLKGNSIFFLTPPLLAIFLASPLKKQRRKKVLNPFVSALWVTLIATLIPILMHFGSGWMQFGYRYSLDVTGILILLAVFGMKGRVNLLFVLGVIVSIYLYVFGIQKLM